MFDFVKNILRERYLRKAASKASTGLSPLSAVKSAIVLIDAEEPEYDACKEAVAAYFKGLNIKVDFFFLDFSKKNEDERQITSLNTTILRKDVNWYGRPSREKISMIAETGGDVFISLADNAEFPVECIAKCSVSKFKIGRIQTPHKTFDLVVEDPTHNQVSQQEAFSEIVKILETVR